MDRTERLRIQLETQLPAEWMRLVRLCAGMSGCADAAEDLAQETMIEAWRHAGQLRDPDALRPWLSGIARNVCLRWSRAQARDASKAKRIAHHAHWMGTGEESAVEVDMERDELATLLDRAMERLPATTRSVVEQQYIDELSQAEIADRLGLSEGAIAVRAHRGRQALKQALTAPELRAEAATYGLVDPDAAAWRQTRIWCPFCGRHRLRIRIDPATRLLFAMCNGACADSGAIIGGTQMHSDTAALTSTKSIVARELVHLHEYYRQSLAERGSRCLGCGRHVVLEQWSPDRPLATPTVLPYGLRMLCAACGTESSASLWHLLLDNPIVQQFWRRQPRMAALPVRAIERDGIPALVSGFASTDGSTRLEIVSAHDTYDVLHVNGPTGT